MAETSAPRGSFDDPELRRKVFFTIGALAVLRVGAYIPVPGVDAGAFSALLDARGGPLGVLNAFSGGALGRFALFSLGAIPYINASIVAGLLKLGRGKRERAEAARRLTFPLALLQSLALAFALARTTAPGGAPLVADAGAFFYLTTATTLTAGAMFVLWLCEEITASGIGGGALLVVFACLIANALSGAETFFRLVRFEEIGAFSTLFIVAALLAAVFAVIRIETAQRKLTVNYSQRVVGRRMYGGSSSALPVKLDQAGVVAAVCAAALGASTLVLRGGWLDDAIYAALIVYFSCFAGAKTVDANELSEQLKKSGGSLPGIRPGDATARHILWVHERVALGGAVFVAAVAILPDLLRRIFRLPFFFDGVQAVIVVAVALDAMTRVESHSMMRTYAKFMK
jgi:preprotein translocase subunit SecY